MAATVVSMSSPLPTPVAASITSVALAALTSNKVSLPTTPLSVVKLIFTAPVLARPPMVISSFASSVIAASPASTTVPAFIVIAPPLPLLSESLSAVMVIVSPSVPAPPDPESTSPSTPKITSSSAFKLIVPLCAVTASFIVKLESPATVILTESALPAVLTLPPFAETVVAPSATTVIEPAVA